MDINFKSSLMIKNFKTSFYFNKLPHLRLSQSFIQRLKVWIFSSVANGVLYTPGVQKLLLSAFILANFSSLIYVLLAFNSCLTSYLNYSTWKGWIFSVPHRLALCWPKSWTQMEDLQERNLCFVLCHARADLGTTLTLCQLFANFS